MDNLFVDLRHSCFLLRYLASEQVVGSYRRDDNIGRLHSFFCLGFYQY